MLLMPDHAGESGGHITPRPIHTYRGSGVLYAAAPARERGAVNDLPVLLFVPGLGQTAEFFFRENPILAMAVRDGYRTAVVSFDRPEGKAQDMWANGELLARQAADACRFYGVQNLTAVGHSKGGVDAQSAAVHFGAAGCIGRIVTLSTPHWGSQLADIAYSSAGFALAKLLHAHSPGCFSMQTGYMQGFRNSTDPSPQNLSPILTFAGNGGNVEPGRVMAGSLLLDRFGQNDGVVTVESAHNPKGRHVATLRLNHAQMGDGRFVWAYVAPVLAGEPPAEEAVAAGAVPVFMPPAQILRGGWMTAGVNERFFVDGSVERMRVCITCTGDAAARRFTLASPAGVGVALTEQKAADGSSMLCAEIASPQVGRWSLTAPRARGAYCAQILLRGTRVFQLAPGEAPPEKLDAALRILHTYADGYDVVGEYELKKGVSLPLPQVGDGVYSVEMELTGELPDGSTFERTVIRPFAHGGDLRGLSAGPRRSARH